MKDHGKNVNDDRRIPSLVRKKKPFTTTLKIKNTFPESNEQKTSSDYIYSSVYRRVLEQHPVDTQDQDNLGPEKCEEESFEKGHIQRKLQQHFVAT